MFTSLVYDIKNKQAILRTYEDVEDYALTPSFTKEEKKFQDIIEVNVSGKLRKVEVSGLYGEPVGEISKIEFLSDTIKCEKRSVTLIDGKKYYGLLCKAEMGVSR